MNVTIAGAANSKKQPRAAHKNQPKKNSQRIEVGETGAEENPAVEGVAEVTRPPIEVASGGPGRHTNPGGLNQ